MARVVIDYAPRDAFKSFHKRKERWAVVVAHRRAGKALDVATPIPMADGTWRNMGDLVDGDVVLDDRGAPCNVVAAHPVQLNRPCYVVRFDDGSEVVCDEDHLWTTQTKLDRARHTGVRVGPRGNSRYISRTHAPSSGTTKTTAEIRDSLMYGKERNHSVWLSGPAQYPEAELKVDPYVLGLWLGDGTSRNAQFTTMDGEIVESLTAFCKSRGLSFNAVHSANTGRAKTYSCAGDKYGSLSADLRSMGLRMNKHIPADYLAASVEQRIALLQGLMDTDGSIDSRVGKSPRCDITQKSKVLADGICRLLYSLGEAPGMNEKVVNGTVYYRINFRSAFNPFRLSRKADLWKPPHATHAFSRKRYIVAVEPVPSRPVRCITVDSESRLYLCSHKYVPTHNTVACINDMIRRAVTDGKKDARYAYIAPYYNQAKSVAWDYLMRFSEPIRKSQNISELWVELVNGARIRLFGADNADALRGLYFDGVVLDEYGDWRAGVYSTVIRPALSDRKGWAVFIGTPKGKNAFYDLWEGAETEESWMRLKVKASESGILDAEELADAKRSMTDDQYSQEYECSFEAAVVGAVYSKEMAMVRDADQISRVPYDPSLPVHTAWDLGVGDATAIVFWQQIGREVRVIDCYEASGEGLPHYASVIKAKPYNYGTHFAPHDIAVREFGSGKSRIDVAREWDIDFVMAPKQSLEDGIHAVRMLLPRCWFDAKKCELLTEALHHYRWDMDNKSGELKPRPVHDWSSHFADAARYMALSMQEVASSRPAFRAARTDFGSRRAGY